MSTWKVELYETQSGRSPVADFIKAQSKHDQARIFAELDELLEFGPLPRGQKLRQIRGKLWEYRFSGKRGPFRFFFFTNGRRIVVVHAICKKTQRTPRQDIRLALDRMTDYLKRL